jgi:DNA-binding response OmpR family regulator
VRETPLILAADDDPDILELVRIRLKRAGYEVVTATDGDEALRTARELLPDLCILDVVMPQRTGFEILGELRVGAETARIPVILLTATVQEREQARGAALGAAGYLTKPFNAAELDRLIRELLGRGESPKEGL